MNESPKDKTARQKLEFLLNVRLLNLQWNDNWRIYEIDLEEWDGNQTYNVIRAFRLSSKVEDLLIESHGRLLIFIPLKENAFNEKSIETIETNLRQKMGRNLKLKYIPDPLNQARMNSAILEAIRKGIGELVTYQLNQLKFRKIGSGGGVGEFVPPDNWSDEKNQIQIDKATIIRVFSLSVIPNIEENQYYLAADLKGRYQEEQNLSEWINRNMNFLKNHPPVEMRNNKWQMKKSADIKLLFSDEIIEEVFEVQGVSLWEEIKNKPLGYGLHAKKILFDLMNSEKIPENWKNSSWCILKPSGRIIADPNINLVLPAVILYRNLSQPRDDTIKEAYKRFTRIPMPQRYKLITFFFEELQKLGLIRSELILESYPMECAKPSVRTHLTQEFGQAPQLHLWGVESWGPLKRSNIIFEKSDQIFPRIKEFYNILKDYLNKLKELSGMAQTTVEINLSPIENNKLDFKNIIKDLDRTCCPIIFTGKTIKNYNEIKTKFTQECGIPVQVIEGRTLKGSRNLTALIRTVVPQIIAKTGGLPYKLSPPILDRALLIGLDKARDSSGRRPSASAGVAAVTPEGRYISGASTPLERSSTDFINVDDLAPPLLKELVAKKFEKNYDYVVILRDGAPATCINEVPRWEHYLQDYQKEFIFISARKTHDYRLFPRGIDESKIQYELPMVLNGKPLLPEDFLVLSARAPQGTPKPVLYTVMRNTTDLSSADIKEKVISQIISMSMLCWESPLPTSQPLPLHYAHKLADFTQRVQQAWNSSNEFPMFI